MGGKKRARLSAVESELEAEIFGNDILVAKSPQKREIKAVKELAEAPAWEDDDDEELEVMLDDTSRLRKLKQNKDENGVSGVEFTARLQQRLKSRNLAWASQFDDIYGQSDYDKLMRSNASL